MDIARWVKLVTRKGQGEQASVASFARFSLDLLSVGAPADLVDDAHDAAKDEIQHAKLAFGLASFYLGETVQPTGYPVIRSISHGRPTKSMWMET